MNLKNFKNVDFNILDENGCNFSINYLKYHIKNGIKVNNIKLKHILNKTNLNQKSNSDEMVLTTIFKNNNILKINKKCIDYIIINTDFKKINNDNIILMAFVNNIYLNISKKTYSYILKQIDLSKSEINYDILINYFMYKDYNLNMYSKDIIKLIKNINEDNINKTLWNPLIYYLFFKNTKNFNLSKKEKNLMIAELFNKKTDDNLFNFLLNVSSMLNFNKVEILSELLKELNLNQILYVINYLELKKEFVNLFNLEVIQILKNKMILDKVFNDKIKNTNKVINKI